MPVLGEPSKFISGLPCLFHFFLNGPSPGPQWSASVLLPRGCTYNKISLLKKNVWSTPAQKTAKPTTEPVTRTRYKTRPLSMPVTTPADRKLHAFRYECVFCVLCVCVCVCLCLLSVCLSVSVNKSAMTEQILHNAPTVNGRVHLQ